MRNVLTIARRELMAYLQSPVGYVIVAVLLLIDGLLFNAFALGAGAHLSTNVLQQFFHFSSGVAVIAAILLSMRLFAEERQIGTMVLLRTAPVSEWEIVAGKFLSVLVFLGGMIALTVYMPLLIMVNGKVTIGHILIGYLGVLLIGTSAIAIGIFASALTRSQVLAAIVAGAIFVSLLICWLLARVTEPPLSSVFEHLAIHNLNFRPFKEGVLHLRHVVYYLSVTYLFLLLSVRALAARRWS